MSGTGQNDASAPTRLTPPTGDMPFTEDRKGGQSWLTMYGLQMLQRLLAYIGQPVTGNPPGQTLSSQVAALNGEIGLAIFAPSTDTPTQFQVQQLRQRVARLQAKPPARPGLNQGQVLARVWFNRY